MACWRTAPAGSCSHWHARCWQPSAASNFLCHRYPAANRGTAPVAEEPCTSSSASPLHNSISKVSIPHDRLRQSARHACFTHAFPAVCPQHSARPQNNIHHHPGGPASQIALSSDDRLPSSTAKKTAPQNNSTNYQSYSISIIPGQDHRGRGKRLRLPSSPLIENASEQLSLPKHSAPRHFRSRLAVGSRTGAVSRRLSLSPDAKPHVGMGVSMAITIATAIRFTKTNAAL
jgi:hypothetical protein